MIKTVHKSTFAQNKLDRNKLNKNYKNHLHIGPACAKVKKRRTSEHLLVKAKSYETLAKGTVAKLLYGHSDAKRSDYKTNRKTRKIQT